MVIADVITATSAALLVSLFLSASVEPKLVYIVLFLRSVASAVQGPAMVASTSLMVPAEHLARVGGLNQAFRGVVSLSSPPLAAILLSLLPMPAVMALDVITAFIAVVPLLVVRVPRPRQEGHSPQLGISVIWRDTVVGFSYLWKHREVFLLTTTGSFVDFFTAPAMTFLPLLVIGHFHGGPLELGWMQAAQGAGMIAGGLALSGWGGFPSRLRTALLGWAITGLACVAIGLAPRQALWFAITSAFVLGFSFPIGGAPVTALYQSVVSPSMQGRFFSTCHSLSQLVVLLGLAVGGALGDRLGVRLWWVLAGLGHTILTGFWLKAPAGRRLDESDSSAGIYGGHMTKCDERPPISASTG